jgi:hypothetical protein
LQFEGRIERRKDVKKRRMKTRCNKRKMEEMKLKEVVWGANFLRCNKILS